MTRRITDDIDKLKQVLPYDYNQALEVLGQPENLVEIVLDLGRTPTVRFVGGEVPLMNREVTREDLDAITANIGDFDADNRAGMERTLHRISAIRNRKGQVVGLTCRVGRAVYGTIDIIEDLIASGKSLLILGPPGVGKTTILREAARVMADKKRVVIVDTSNEIGGDGDVPHPAVGRARRMQVSRPDQQHEVMIEAVENHNPEVIVIDEIGRELEAMAARTIAERGVQLIGTAHGNALDNLLLNPTLSDLVGGIESVTLSDEEARRRGTQKTVLERRAPPTFQVLVEIQTRDRMLVHPDVAAAVDGILRGKPLPVEVRQRDQRGEIVIETAQPQTSIINERSNARNGNGNGGYGERPERPAGKRRSERERDQVLASENRAGHSDFSRNQPMRVYAYGVARNRLEQVVKRLRVPLTMVDEYDEADAVITVKNYYRSRPRAIIDAERRGMPIYVMRANTISQMENLVADLFHLEDVSNDDPFEEAMREVETAIYRVRGGAEYVDLVPRASHIRRKQHELAHRAKLESESFGDEPQRHVRIYRTELA
jgi:stage III sporulation protein SpoIIIAA